MTANCTKAGFKILVDADACPVKDIISEVAVEFDIAVVLVASIAHKTEQTFPNTEQIWVDSSPQAVDMAIVNRLSPGDLIVTGDYGLASLVLAKGGRAISPRGHLYHHKNIDTLLMQRHVDAKIRRSGGKTRGPKAFSGEDKKSFTIRLRGILTTIKDNENFSH